MAGLRSRSASERVKLPQLDPKAPRAQREPPRAGSSPPMTSTKLPSIALAGVAEPRAVGVAARGGYVKKDEQRPVQGAQGAETKGAAVAKARGRRAPVAAGATGAASAAPGQDAGRKPPTGRIAQKSSEVEMKAPEKSNLRDLVSDELRKVLDEEDVSYSWRRRPTPLCADQTPQEEVGKVNSAAPSSSSTKQATSSRDASGNPRAIPGRTEALHPPDSMLSGSGSSGYSGSLALKQVKGLPGERRVSKSMDLESVQQQLPPKLQLQDLQPTLRLVAYDGGPALLSGGPLSHCPGEKSSRPAEWLLSWLEGRSSTNFMRLAADAWLREMSTELRLAGPVPDSASTRAMALISGLLTDPSLREISPSLHAEHLESPCLAATCALQELQEAVGENSLEDELLASQAERPKNTTLAILSGFGSWLGEPARGTLRVSPSILPPLKVPGSQFFLFVKKRKVTLNEANAAQVEVALGRLESSGAGDAFLKSAMRREILRCLWCFDSFEQSHSKFTDEWILLQLERSALAAEEEFSEAKKEVLQAENRFMDRYLVQLLKLKRGLASLLDAWEKVDHYQILGVSKSASDKELRNAYRKACLRLHPDKGGDKLQFQQLQDAYAHILEERQKEMKETKETKNTKVAKGEARGDWRRRVKENPFTFWCCYRFDPVRCFVQKVGAFSIQACCIVVLLHLF